MFGLGKCKQQKIISTNAPQVIQYAGMLIQHLFYLTSFDLLIKLCCYQGFN